LNSKITVSLRHHENHATLFEFYRALIRLRKEIPALSHSDRKKSRIKRFGKKRALFIQRQCDSNRIVCLLNFDSSPTAVKTLMEPGRWQKLMDSSSAEWKEREERHPRVSNPTAAKFRSNSHHTPSFCSGKTEKRPACVKDHHESRDVTC